MSQPITPPELVALFESYQSFVLTSHLRPDGDAIGSMLGLGLTLESLGKEVRYLHQDGVPANLAFLEDPAHPRIELAGSAEAAPAEVFVALDTANRERLGEDVLALCPSGCRAVTIDHHVTNERYGDLVWIDDQSPATAQMVWELAQAGGWPIPAAARAALYVGASTDTGSFQYANTTARTHEMAADLLAAGLEVAELNRLTYQNFPYRRVELLRLLLETLQRSEDGKLAWWSLSLAMKNEVGYQPGDSEGLIDVMRGIDEVVACVFFEEISDGTIRVSSRSKSPALNVSELCGQFGGGGHILAAGARLPGPLPEARQQFVAALMAAAKTL
ncbi:DHH family phosphoesterase [Roseibacillus ishigakijimensis]|uniref:Bifunctional oligoribonuclease/PAP phosphatase NrnA n=1 Tax=Roseibacillus ishigakijimensis TaxID=454146 RepID=A0A934VL62_9BACT|nr:bifunctional oligoribonuclease/PAP phosphatase NrnA [Roseibacillus ishigakijimensis]MBK1834349.1 bifunctional oligoribonuclease/PAP phosphatase NrnA [Roseibacillus ishigakijimensis]